MVTALGLVLLLSATPPQGFSVAVPKLECTRTSDAACLVVQQAITEELKRQGYGTAEEKGAPGVRATIRGRLMAVEQGLVVELVLVRTDNDAVLDDARVQVANEKALPAAVVKLTQGLARELRLAFGVRARIKL